MAKIIDNFILIETLGQGRFSETLKGRNLVSKSPVAVKTIKLDQFLNNQSLREMVINEIQILKKFDNANILQMLKMLKSSNNIYLIYEYLNGGKLSAYLSKNGAMNESKLLVFVKQMTEALLVVHKEDVIHNNISPEIFYLADELVKLKNFLAARGSNNKKAVEPEVYKYASPEILQNRSIGFKSDVYSLGLTFYEMAIGHSLYDCSVNERDQVWEKIEKEVIRGHLLEKDESWSEFISNDMKDLIKNMLRIDENERIGLDEVYQKICKMSQCDNGNVVVERNEEARNMSRKLDRFFTKERNKVQFIMQNIQRVLGLTQWIIEFPRNLLVLSLLKIALFGLDSLISIISEGKSVGNIDNFIINSSNIDGNELKTWVSTDFAVFFISNLKKESQNLKEVIEKFSKEETIEGESYNLNGLGLEWLKNEEAIDEKGLMKWLYFFSLKVFELISKQKENGEVWEEEVKKEQGILANYLLDVIFFKEFFENFIKSDGKLQEQKYFKHVEGVPLEKLQGMLEKKLNYAKKQLCI